MERGRALGFGGQNTDDVVALPTGTKKGKVSTHLLPRKMALALEKEDDLQKSVSVQEEVLVGSEQERLLLLTSMLGVAEHELISTQDRLNAMQQLQTERDQACINAHARALGVMLG